MFKMLSAVLTIFTLILTKLFLFLKYLVTLIATISKFTSDWRRPLGILEIPIDGIGHR